MSDIYWDPFDPALRDDPYPLWKRLRDEAPAYHNERLDFWVLSRYGDVEAAHKDHGTFSSAHMTTIEMMTPEPVRTARRPAVSLPSAVEGTSTAAGCDASIAACNAETVGATTWSENSDPTATYTVSAPAAPSAATSSSETSPTATAAGCIRRPAADFPLLLFDS